MAFNKFLSKLSIPFTNKEIDLLLIYYVVGRSDVHRSRSNKRNNKFNKYLPTSRPPNVDNERKIHQIYISIKTHRSFMTERTKFV